MSQVTFFVAVAAKLTSNIVLKNVAPFVIFGPPCCEILVTGLRGRHVNYGVSDQRWTSIMPSQLIQYAVQIYFQILMLSSF